VSRVHPRTSVTQLTSSPHVARALRFFETHAESITEEHIRICSVPATPFAEHERAEYLRQRFSDLGMTEVEIDAEGNCLGLLEGASRSPLLVVSAHLDTVFAKDTDFTAKLVDVYPDGKAYNVQEGVLRARYREGFTKTAWMKAGEPNEIPIDLEATSNYFGPGHRIRLEISSSNFPRFDRNLNTGGNNYDETKWLSANNQIHHAGGKASYILLPVIPER